MEASVIGTVLRNKQLLRNITIAYNAIMYLDALKIFQEVMHFGSFTEVAKRRGVAPSSISRSIAAIEKQLSVRLFQRNTRKLRPTEAALLYYERITPLLQELEDASQFTKECDQIPRGTLRVSASISYGQKVIVPILAELALSYPELHFECLFSDSYIDLIEERVDVALRLGTLQDSSYIARKLAPIDFYICASPDYLQRFGTPTSPHDIEHHNCLLFPRQGYNFDWIFKQNDSQFTVAVSGSHLINHSASVKDCAVAGLGLILLPDWLVDDDIISGRLTRLFTQYQVTASDFDSAIWLLYPSKQFLPLKTRIFMDYIIHKLSR